ncbi:YolD-like family protein [Alkalicoccus luteus]|uniref:YolD-like family protein n=1 Tax=Alkalicoccus luteus TaxID=1237094 RepID=A0A969PV35_9BACI|nr:YolD-like family protein [Alkalicoccus luteus]NJP38926.1 YolD-like family protein [Alkalicoccus luteus]
MNDRYLKRGNLMWEGSRMMLHEHTAALKKRAELQKRTPPPALTSEDWELFGERLHAASEHEFELELLYWQDGSVFSVTGVPVLKAGYIYIEETRLVPEQLIRAAYA